MKKFINERESAQIKAAKAFARQLQLNQTQHHRIQLINIYMYKYLSCIFVTILS